MKIGVDYYPEQWDPDLWEQDADQMKQMGIRIVRMAEFAWSRLEPQEGKWDFNWLDRAVRLFTDRGMEVFLCTPTCTPPLWAFEKYPEITQRDVQGQPVAIGIRGHRCLNSPVFRRLAERMIRQMVTHYKDWEGVIGYQIDNELEANHCRCAVCQTKFRQWIQERYKNVSEVNKAYGNSVWSGEYSDFSQVKPPMGELIRWQNPSLTLDYNRYASDSTVDYVRFQEKLIRKIDPTAKITTNNWLCEHMPDFYKLFETLDFVSYDNYPTTAIPKDEQELYSHAFHLDLMRGIKRKNFWIMEQLSGSVGSWMPMSQTPRPGMIKGYAMQAIAHGADAVLHFRWRTAVSGAEMYWHGILGHDNVPGRRYREVHALCQTVNGWDALDGSVISNRVALLYGSDQEYGFKLQHQAEEMYYLEQLKLLHDGFTSIGVGVDIVDEKQDLSAYDIVLAPNLLIDHPVVRQHLYQFVERGGCLVLTARCGVKDTYNKCIMEPLPTGYRELAGITVKEYDPIGDRKQQLRLETTEWQQEWKSVQTRWNQASSQPVCRQWCELLEPCEEEVRVLARYDETFYRDTAAVTEHTYGKGTCYYLGTILERQMYSVLARQTARRAGISYEPELPLGIEITTRSKGEMQWSFLFNNTEKEQRFYARGKQWSLAPFEMRIDSQKG